jgi:hypothetical protein
MIKSAGMFPLLSYKQINRWWSLVTIVQTISKLEQWKDVTKFVSITDRKTNGECSFFCMNSK